MRARYHILHLSSAHTPDVRIFDKEARTLAAAGHAVEVWARHPQAEVREGVRIRPVPPPRSRLHRMAFVPAWIMRECLRLRADFHHLHDPELLPMGMLLALTGRRVVYDVHEDLPGSIRTKEWIALPLRRLVASAAWLLERTAMGLLAGFAPATPAIARRFPRDRTQVVQNLPRFEEFTRHDGVRAPAGDRVIFAYVGALTELRGAIQMLDALALTPAHFHLVIMGEMSPAGLLERLSAHPAWGKVTYLGQRPRADATRLLMTAHAGLVLFHPAPNHTEAQPNKLFEYMAAGLPVIASHFPLWRDLIEGAGCGWLVDPLDSAAIASAMRAVADDPRTATAMGVRGRNAVQTRLNWTAEGAGLVRFYERLAADDQRPVI
jgi:glycosyltransferase involved in cell wall biosynthesis